MRESPGTVAAVVVGPGEAAAVEAITRLAADLKTVALFVVDGMTAATRSRVSRLLAAASQRLRVIAVDNDRVEEQVPEGEVRLAGLSRKGRGTDPRGQLPGHSERAALGRLRLGRGFVRLAVDACRNVHRVPHRGDVAALAPFLRDEYLAARLSDEQRAVVELVSLVARAEYHKERAGELRALCSAVPAAGLTPERVVDAASRMRHAPGFVAVRPRDLYITPPGHRPGRVPVEQNGLDGARAIAQHLPAPELVGDDPVVPAITAFVLDRFGQDPAVARSSVSRDPRVGPACRVPRPRAGRVVPGGRRGVRSSVRSSARAPRAATGEEFGRLGKSPSRP